MQFEYRAIRFDAEQVHAYPAFGTVWAFDRIGMLGRWLVGRHRSAPWHRREHYRTLSHRRLGIAAAGDDASVRLISTNSESSIGWRARLSPHLTPCNVGESD
jgi:hypothetical protein